MKFKKYINEDFQEQMGLVEVYDDGDDNIIMYGDYYHDKIEAKIEGFLIGIEFTNNEYEIEEELITEDHDLYNQMDFCPN